jgi:hypothetical protein
MWSTAQTVRQAYPLGSRSFDKVRVEGVIDVKLTQGNEQKVEVEATADCHQHIQVDVTDDQVLSIRTAGRFRSPKKLVAHVDVTTLKSCVLDNLVGTVESTNTIEQNDKFSLQVNGGTATVNLNLNALALDAIISGTSTCKLMGNVTNETNMRSEGVFQIDASSLITSRMNLVANGVGRAFIHAMNQVNIEASGACQIYYRGPLGMVRQHGIARVSEHV